MQSIRCRTNVTYAKFNISVSIKIILVVDKGSNVNWVNRQKRTPLHLAVIGRNEEVVKALLKVGANVNIQVILDNCIIVNPPP